MVEGACFKITKCGDYLIETTKRELSGGNIVDFFAIAIVFRAIGKIRRKYRHIENETYNLRIKKKAGRIDRIRFHGPKMGPSSETARSLKGTGARRGSNIKKARGGL